MAINDSILDSIKKTLGVDAAFLVWDEDIKMHINGVFSTLAQLGVGPEDGFEIDDKENKWAEFLGENKLINSVRSYMYLRVRMLFDPPTTSFDLTAKTEMIKELEWRLNVAVDKGLAIWVPITDTSVLLYNLTGGRDFPAYAPIGAVGIDTLNGNSWVKE